MDIQLLDESFNVISIIDTAESFFWVDRYNSQGQFELYMGMTVEAYNLFQEDYYIKIAESEKMMIVESKEIKTDLEKGDKLIVRGRSLESILDRRIVWYQKLYTSIPIHNIIEDLVDKCCINPEGTNPLDHRKIPNMIWMDNTESGVMTATTRQYASGDILLTDIEDLCREYSIGYKVILDSSNQFVVSVYAGKNRSANQSTYPVIMFSPKYDNLLSSNYYRSKAPFKTANYVLGFIYDDGQRHVVYTVLSPYQDYAGLKQREMFTNIVGEFPRYIEGTTTLIDTNTYNAQLTSRGFQILLDNGVVQSFDGEADLFTTYKYGVDFFLGDIIQIENEYGISARARITEYTISENTQSGRLVYPTLVII